MTSIFASRAPRGMIVTISGTPGSGKSTVAKKLARFFGYPRFDMGERMRRQARRRGMSLSELIQENEQNPAADHSIDAFQRRLGKTRRNAIVEGRLSFHFISHSVKIFLYASPAAGAKRIWKELRASRTRNEDWNMVSRARLLRTIRQRMRSDHQRYQQYYRLNPFLRKHYDLYLDTTNLRPDIVFRRVRDFVVGATERRRQRPRRS